MPPRSPVSPPRIRSFRAVLAFVTVFVCIATASLRADLEFTGILVTSQTTRFALTDTATGKSDWRERGQTFGGYTIISYEPKDETLLLRQDTQDLRLRLKDDAKVKAARLELTGTIAFNATEKVEVERATLQFDEENVFPLKDGVTYRITPTRLPDGTHRYQFSIERVLAPNKTERISAPLVRTLPGQPFSLQIGDLGFSFLPR